ncbi:MAG TPA: sensor histidine kinase KdpD [Planctomycetota bacterium]|nr:sensor histidine kinase KdpD [Planctomycetota bacterium]
MAERRPDPGELLERAREEERRRGRGKLKVYFGAAPGVGKTYAMLEHARRLYAQGVDLVVGYVEPHARTETMALLIGLELLPTRPVEYRGTTLAEFDLDAALARRPAILLVDELAHTNAPGSRFAKRWQDVEALLDAGIHVHTTLNVQHLESLNDVVQQITGVEVRETVPDAVIETADEVELVDLPPDALLERLQQGRVYVPEIAREALGRFFRKGNLGALRELSLRRTAQWVDAQLRTYKTEQGIQRAWPASERVLVCVEPGPLGPSILRAAKRLAVELRAELIAVHVQTPLALRLPQDEAERVLETLRLAESMDAEAVTLSGDSVVDELLAYARKRDATKIVVGKPPGAAWRERLFGSVASELIRRSGEIDVYVIHGDAETPEPERPAPRRSRAPARTYALAAMIVSATTAALTWLAPDFAIVNVAMVYLLVVMLVAVSWGRGPSIAASLLSVGAFDFFFVPPKLTFAFSDSQYLVTFAVMLAVALLTSGLVTRVRAQAEEARERGQRTARFLMMSRELAAARGEEEVIAAGTRHLRDVLDGAIAVMLRGPDGSLEVSAHDRTAFPMEPADRGAAQWAYDHGQIAGLSTSTLPGAGAVFVPLEASRGRLGAVGLRPRERRPLAATELHALETLVRQLGLALERARLIREAQGAALAVETERMRTALLTSVSHDLRTPLAVIHGAATALQQEGAPLAASARRDLVDSIVEESERLARIVENLLFATRLEAGAVDLRRDWIGIDDVVSAALTRLGGRLRDRKVETSLPHDLPLVHADGVLLEQVVLQLLENALRYSPPGTPIEIAAWASEQAVVVRVTDHGPGLPKGEEQRIFERFYRARPAIGAPGLGLGLFICRAIVSAHGGRIWGESSVGRGTIFYFAV